MLLFGPFRAYRVLIDRLPGAIPRADLLGPFGTKRFARAESGLVKTVRGEEECDCPERAQTYQPGASPQVVESPPNPLIYSYVRSP